MSSGTLDGQGTRSLDRERLARAYLLRVAEPPAPALVELVARHGPILAADRVRAGECSGRVVDETAARRGIELAEQDFDEAGKCDGRLVIPEDDEWPAWPLLALEMATSRGAQGVSPPLGLWVRGAARLDEVADRAVAIVGARASTRYGEQVASEWAHGLSGQDMPVLSGAAYGIDGAAHRGALHAGGLTAAVLGCGLDQGYPAGHVALLDRIAEHGLVVSEYPPGTPPARHRFLVRNRLIAALSDGTIVVEAGARSGARNTASTAGVLGKVVMAVPGPVSSAMSVGCHGLIRDAGATLVASLAEVVETVGRLGVAAPERAKPRRRTDGLDEQSLRVHEALAPRTGKPSEQLAAESGVPLPRVRAVLPVLELDGLAERCEGGWRRSRNPATAPPERAGFR
ncbi:DNA-processing protein DprA [Amycolatopsis nigrescens]|uniref:DNA-processing protein DprA n=1 Tax=Amycolatopsis nigrescens TaxID=381445 RepID=UPI00036B4FCB|nr:DNA-processing protein DprA [Amycolatopsis nigrescens]